MVTQEQVDRLRGSCEGSKGNFVERNGTLVKELESWLCDISDFESVANKINEAVAYRREKALVGWVLCEKCARGLGLIW